MHVQAYYFFLKEEGSLYCLLVFIIYDLCLHVYLTKSTFKIICTTIFYTSQVRNRKRMNVL